MAAGLPIVASRAGQITEMIEHGRTGLLVPPGDIPALTMALGQVYAHREAAWRLGAAARQVACERFSWRRVVDQILAIAARPEPTASGASSAARRTA
jgi:glycosyltransferase involved in cell wall biosynthesis